MHSIYLFMLLSGIAVFASSGDWGGTADGVPSGVLTGEASANEKPVATKRISLAIKEPADIDSKAVGVLLSDDIAPKSEWESFRETKPGLWYGDLLVPRDAESLTFMVCVAAATVEESAWYTDVELQPFQTIDLELLDPTRPEDVGVGVGAAGWRRFLVELDESAFEVAGTIESIRCIDYELGILTPFWYGMTRIGDGKWVSDLRYYTAPEEPDLKSARVTIEVTYRVKEPDGEGGDNEVTRKAEFNKVQVAIVASWWPWE